MLGTITRLALLTSSAVASADQIERLLNILGQLKLTEPIEHIETSLTPHPGGKATLTVHIIRADATLTMTNNISIEIKPRTIKVNTKGRK